MTIEQTIAHDLLNATCGCPGCNGVNPDFIGDASLDPLAGTNHSNGKPIWTADQIAAHLNRTGGGFANGFGNETLNGRQNNIGDGNDVITFGFFDTQDQLFDNGYVYSQNGGLFGLAEYFNFAPMTDAQRAATREAMQSWDDVVAVRFVEASADDADMNFGNLASAPTTQAYARIPTAALDSTLGGQVREIGGDSWISASQASNFQLDEGGYGLQTLLHEAGHSIGISHPGAYNGTGNYVTQAEYAQDTRAYSVMSYFNASTLGGRHFDFNISTTVFSAVPLIHDIAAAQRIYGADMTTRTGDTTYGFNASADLAGRDSFDFTKTPAPVAAIWDAGGIDTIDASGYATTQLIDLTAGSLSSIGGVTFDTAPSYETVLANRTAAGFSNVGYTRAVYDGNMAALKNNPEVGRLTDNFGIAYGVTIENAVGGSGRDTIIGNEVANVLTGNAGNDDLFGRVGNDTLNGGIGNDLLVGGAGADVLDGGAGFDIASYRDSADGITVNSSSRGYTVNGDGVGDLYINIEAIEGSALFDRMNGGNADDIFFGFGGDDIIEGGNGDDTLDGGDGNDTLRGGNNNDTLTGGAGNDFLDGGNSNDNLDGGAGDDRLEGGNSSDTLLGGAGDDVLEGGNSSDVLNGGAGNDTLRGGNSSDTFVFGLDAVGGTDTILDYDRGETIDLSAFKSETTKVTFDQGKIFVDLNGDDVAELTIVVQGDAVNPVDVVFG